MIIEPFNLTFFIFLLIFAGVFAFLTVIARRHDEAFDRKLLGRVSAIFVPIYIVHVIANTLDPVLCSARAAVGLAPNVIWSALPFQLCYINTLLIPVAAFSGNRRLEHFCAMTSLPSALAALVNPTVGYKGTDIFAVSVMTYYLFHFAILFCGLSLFTFRLILPKYRDIPWTFLMLTVCGIVAHIVNIVLRQTGLFRDANYCFTMSPEFIPPLEMIYSVIPVPLLYAVVAAVILFGTYMFPVTAIVNAVSKRSKRADSGGGQ